MKNLIIHGIQENPINTKEIVVKTQNDWSELAGTIWGDIYSWGPFAGGVLALVIIVVSISKTARKIWGKETTDDDMI